MVALVEHCVYCFDVLRRHFDPQQEAEPEFKNGSQAYPLFVTWKVQPAHPTPDDEELRLRGCIGNFNAMPLQSGLEEYALTSALRDRRFAPITSKEVPWLTCAVSLLTDFTLGSDYLDWEIGKHGIWIEFRNEHGKRKTATYLPEIAAEQGWSKVETIDSLLRKGGYRGHITETLRASIKLTRYQSSKCALSYDDYLAYCESRDTRPHITRIATCV
ncbi:AMMECR1 domain-containing protein [Thamnocephalis sphaerospora]|uniref:AMMECR1 domain-containing protein n=1 Tax=Thamnocephalis sphaerospora TaxID=78915 RepID=A0A4P9XN58_9FUNG|nr:AMMECR1 domain-containing protein [Thamnocephalis sphaerospora]|eukprot:RKP07345.1 AMMECR1 domain-containing protein [Thamnocephalis sphaerospora]